MIAYLGSGALLAGLVMAAFSALLSFWSGWTQSAVMVQVGRRAFFAAAAMLVIAGVLLEVALLTHDFSLAYVIAHTDLSTPLPLVAAAFYGGQEGSLLYWAIVLGLLGSASLVASASLGLRLAAYAAGVLASILAFLLVVLVLVASPFDVVSIIPADGLGLNPLLRDGGMLIHPPVVLAGFASFAIPFSFAAAALLAGRSDAAWIVHTRRFALIAWGLQSTGLVLGMWWAYHVLGWGGYWGWDPVENVALMPWLATTAYLHSSQVQERRGRLRAWNFGLVILAFLLVVFGTFIVRSGVVPSVHTFAVSPIGPWFFGFLAACMLFAFALLAFRADGLRSTGRAAPAVSREGAFVLQNVLLLGAVAVILWGTMLPLVSGLVGQQRVVGAPYYERAAGPIFALLLLLMAAGPLLPWRHAGAAWWRSLAWPAGAFAIVVVALIASGVRSLPSLLALGAVAGVAASCLHEYARATRRWRGWSNLFAMAAARRRRYGAYLAHIGLAVLVAGLAASQFWQQTEDVTLRPGQQATVAGYTLTYTGAEQRQLVDHSETVASMRLGGGAAGTGGQTLEPARAIYASLGGQSLTHVAISSSPLADVYVILVGTGSDGSASFRILVNPLVTWIWAGGAIMILGVILGHAGARRLAIEPVSARVPSPVGAS